MTGSIRDATPKPVLCSLNEIQTTATKAARGAGLPWGLADEAGRAARWLEARGLAGLAALDGALDGLSVPEWRRCFPIPSGSAWRAESGAMDGLLAGMTIADRAGRSLPFASDGTLILAAVRRPLLAIPFLASVAQLRGERLTVSFGPDRPVIGIGSGFVSASCRQIEELAKAEVVRIERGFIGSMPHGLPRLDGSIPIDNEVYACLDRRACKTYVPESAESQARGAGGSNLVESD